MTIKERIEALALKLCANEVERCLAAERVRIWNQIFIHASVKVWPDGNKVSRIISIGEPKLEEIVLPKLSAKFRPAIGAETVEPPEHPLLNHAGPNKEIEA